MKLACISLSIIAVIGLLCVGMSPAHASRLSFDELNGEPLFI